MKTRRMNRRETKKNTMKRKKMKWNWMTKRKMKRKNMKRKRRRKSSLVDQGGHDAHPYRLLLLPRQLPAAGNLVDRARDNIMVFYRQKSIVVSREQ
jgi:hypothetical protein